MKENDSWYNSGLQKYHVYIYTKIKHFSIKPQAYNLGFMLYFIYTVSW